MLELLKQKENLVFVGGFAFFLHGLKKDYKDVDIVVTDLEGIPGVTKFITKSHFSKSGKRASLEKDIYVDIFIEKELPEFEIINGFRVQTKESLINYFEELLSKVDKFWKPIIKSKLKILNKNEQ